MPPCSHPSIPLLISVSFSTISSARMDRFGKARGTVAADGLGKSGGRASSPHAHSKARMGSQVAMKGRNITTSRVPNWMPTSGTTPR